MSVSSEVARLSAARDGLVAAIEAKGVEVPEGSRLDDLPALVSAIPVMTPAEAFLAAHPVGTLWWATADAPSPQQAYGGTWVERPSVLGGRVWERTA